MWAWRRFLSQLGYDLNLWFFFMLLFLGSRLYFITALSSFAKSYSLTDILTAFSVGMRFDLVHATVFVLFPLIGLSLPNSYFSYEKIANRIRFGWGMVIAFVIIFSQVIQVEYYREFNTVFNDTLLGLFHDDLSLIFHTILPDYHVLQNSLIGLFSLLVAYYLLARFQQKSFLSEKFENVISHSVWSRGLFITVLIVLSVGGLHGGYKKRPPQEVDAEVTSNRLLNNSVIPPLGHIRYVWNNFNTVNSSKMGLQSFTNEQLPSVLSILFPDKPKSNQLDDYFKKISSGPKGKVPKHIFLIVMESYDGWLMRDQYDHLGISANLKSFATDGIYINEFVSSYNASIGTYITLISGLPYAGVRINNNLEKIPYGTATAVNFKKLGYKTQLFASCYLNWENLEFFAKNQGFDEIKGYWHIYGKGIQKTTWGVLDGHLFDYIEQSFKSDEPTFNLIITSTNHPPLINDMEKEGAPSEKFKSALKKYPSPTLTAIRMSYYWYADKVMGQFVRSMEKKYPDALFVITGDHPGRRHVETEPSLFDKYAVPLVLYGQSVLKGVSRPQHTAGSHLDIIPTLIELVAPKGTIYSALGHDMLTQFPLIQFLD